MTCNDSFRIDIHLSFALVALFIYAFMVRHIINGFPFCYSFFIKTVFSRVSFQYVNELRACARLFLYKKISYLS